MENFKEEWRPVVGYEGLYEVSNLGNVDSLNNYRRKQKRKRLKPHLDIHGYYFVRLSNRMKTKMFKVHRLVAEAFLKNPNNYPCINHKDENRQNNRVDNLEFCTYTYNNTYGSRIEKMKEKICTPIIQLTKDGEFVARYKSITEAAETNCFTMRNIVSACNGKRDFACGYRWRYEDEERNEKSLETRKKRAERKIEKCKARTKKLSKAVVQLSLDGKIIKEYASIREAVKETGFFTGSIVDNCKGRQKTSHGFIFKYKEDL